MRESPFAYFRGAAGVMADDLATTPASGITVQACGDAHCLNFGGFATPERNHIFDITDFDETLPGPWEWDVKRLGTSLVLAARYSNFSRAAADDAVRAAMAEYRTHIRALGAATPLDVWYHRLDAADVLPDAARADDAQQENAARDMTVGEGDDRRFRDEPPLLYQPGPEDDIDVAEIFADYPASLSPDVRVLFARYRLLDTAIKVVGVGSAGTRCALGLFTSGEDALLLQIKEAQPSVLARRLQASAYEHQGERVIRGQRLMQAASDVFLGWASSRGRHYYLRQFKDKKATAHLKVMDAAALRTYAVACSHALAAGHARSGDAAAIGAYLGKSDVADDAFAAFAHAYAEQSESDYARFSARYPSGRLTGDKRDAISR